MSGVPEATSIWPSWRRLPSIPCCASTFRKTRQDAIILNLQRACERSIDAAIHLVRVHRIGISQETREAFDLLEAAGRLDASIAARLKKMAGFRNVAVHDYPKLNLDVVRHILVERLDDFLEFTHMLLRDDNTPSGGTRA